jgi:hypothetical protein
MNQVNLWKFLVKNWQKIVFGTVFAFIFVLGANQTMAFFQYRWIQIFDKIFRNDWTLFFATLASMVGVLGFLINMVDTAYKKQYEKEQMDIAKLSNKAVIVPESIEDAYFLRGENNGRNIFELLEIVPKIEDGEEVSGWKMKVYDISKNQLIFGIVNIGNGLAKDLELWLSTDLDFRNDKTVYSNVSYLDKSAHKLFYKTNEAKLKNITFKKDVFLKIRYQSAYINEDITEEIFRLNVISAKIENNDIYHFGMINKIQSSKK